MASCARATAMATAAKAAATRSTETTRTGTRLKMVKAKHTRWASFMSWFGSARRAEHGKRSLSVLARTHHQTIRNLSQ